MEEAVQLYQVGWSTTRLDQQFGVDAETVRKELHRAEVVHSAGTWPVGVKGEALLIEPAAGHCAVARLAGESSDRPFAALQQKD